MKKLLWFLCILLITSACGGTKKTAATSTSNNNSYSSADKIVRHAKQFEGTRYKFGGTDKRGMDCSGLVYVSFQEEAIPLPRISRDMAKQGKRISLNDAQKGDLVFFQTSKSRKVINHVGLVVANINGEIKFIHSTTSKGVITSSLDERYWKNAFVEARRVI